MSIAHDDDVRARLSNIGNPRDRWAHRRALRHADRVVVQNDRQVQDLRRDFGREGDLVHNLVALPERAVDAGSGRRVVWLATYTASKRPRWFVELARRMPEHRFVMAGTLLPPPNSPAEWEACRAADVPNLEVRGFVARDELDAFYRDAALFVHTSPAEGVPNALLEAWARGIPSVSGVDPDGAVEREGLGTVARDLDGFAAAVRRWMADPAGRREAGERARDHARVAYDVDRGLEQLAAIFDAEVERVRRVKRR
jgi:glycosyltransferase involved in cell wall biosynthesis